MSPHAVLPRKFKRVEPLTDEEADELSACMPKLSNEAPIAEAAGKLLRHCNRHVLAIVVAGSMLVMYPDEGELILERFETADVGEIVAPAPDDRRSQAFPRQETRIFCIISVS